MYFQTWGKNQHKQDLSWRNDAENHIQQTNNDSLVFERQNIIYMGPNI